MVERILYLDLYLKCIYKKLACAVMWLLDIGVLAPVGAAATTNLNKENQENRRFYPILFEGKYDGVLLIFYTIILSLLQ